MGSKLFNVLAIGGITSMIHPLAVPEEILRRDDWWMISASILLFPIMKSGMRVNRGEGAVLLTGFVVYIALLIRAV